MKDEIVQTKLYEKDKNKLLKKKIDLNKKSIADLVNSMIRTFDKFKIWGEL